MTSQAHLVLEETKVNLHYILSILVMQAMALVRIEAGPFNEIRACARKNWLMPFHLDFEKDTFCRNIVGQFEMKLFKEFQT